MTYESQLHERKENAMEEVIHELKIIETDDGYRIEIKGDKARIKQLFEHMPFGARGFRGGPWGWWAARRHGWHGPFGWGFGHEEEDVTPPAGV
jgi:hypothetical protein